jgi:ABC-type transport system involved in cytochrome bd biosynthesis fused ATPase/permease subunit
VFVDLAAMDSSFVEAVQGMPTAKAFGATGRVRARLAAQAERVRLASMRTLTALFTQMLATRWAVVGAGAVVVVRAGLRAADGRVSATAALTAVFVTLVAFTPVDELLLGIGLIPIATVSATARTLGDVRAAAARVLATSSSTHYPTGTTPLRTTLIIAHRLSTIRRADRVVLLDEGVVIATGRHDDLVAGSGDYRSVLARRHDGTATEDQTNAATA